MPTTLTNGIQLPDKGSVDWYNSMQSNYNLIDTHLGDTDTHVTAEDKANWNSKQGSLSQAQLDAIAQVAINTDDIATLQSGKANVSHTHSSSDITDIGDYATKQYVDNSISGLVDNAPDALNTLNELSAALNDDSNFASTVTTALAGKADSADLATVATSGSYNDLDDLPTIPTNTSDLTNDSDFVVSSNLATVATSGDYDDLSNKPSIPTNTSDLINDSNFVDTSNSAVASGITSAKVTSYDTHIADTDIHVTTADKTKWNNGVSQAYVFRYSSTALVASSTNSNTLLDNTDNLKVGDKVIDSSGVLFSVTAIDSVNSTFTIGTALVDLAQDSNVVHKSGNETVAGIKNFTDDTYIKSLNFTNEVESQSSSSSAVFPIVTTVTYADQSPSQTARLNFRITANGDKSLYPHENNQYSFGVASRRWATLYGYLANLGGTYVGNEASANERTNFYLLANRDTDGQSGAYIGRFRQNRTQGAMSGGDVSFVGLDFLENSTRYTRCFTIGLTDWDSDGVPQTYYFTAPNGKGVLGTSYQQWNKVYANEYYYGSANTEFSDKFVTTDTDQTVTSLKTFMGARTEFKRSNNDGVLLFSNGAFSKGDTPSDATQISRKYYGDGTSVSSSIGYSSFSIQNNGNKTVYQLYSVANTAGSSSRTVFTLNYDKSLSGTNAQYATFGGNVLPDVTGTYNLGNSTSKWATINGLNPSSLGMPDLNNGIDISSYIPALDSSGNTQGSYTPNVNGFIAFRGIGNGCSIVQGNMGNNVSYVTDPQTSNRIVNNFLPVVKDNSVVITIRGLTSIEFIYFYPCQGNV